MPVIAAESFSDVGYDAGLACWSLLYVAWFPFHRLTPVRFAPGMRVSGAARIVLCRASVWWPACPLGPWSLLGPCGASSYLLGSCAVRAFGDY